MGVSASGWALATATGVQAQKYRGGISDAFDAAKEYHEAEKVKRPDATTEQKEA